MTTWPVGLPQKPLINGFGRAPQPNVIAFGTEVGPGKTRRRSTSRTKVLSMPLELTGTELATFEAFFESDLADGSLPFDWTDPVGYGAATYKFNPNPPAYSVSALGGDNFAVTLNLIKQP